jgi:CubicO group peptidase (beta-lactamase class C family)
MRMTPNLLLATLLMATAAVAGAQTCPAEIRGGWEGALPAFELFGLSISVRVDADGNPAGTLRTAAADEELAIWRAGDRLRFQSSHLPLYFDGRISADATAIDGFINNASNLYRVTLRAVGDKSWAGTWTPLSTPAASIRLDLYFDDDEGAMAGYLFFRDERLPGLFGYGTLCDGHRVHVGEKNLGLIFDGVFDPQQKQLDMSVAGPAGSADITFRPMSRERLALRPGTPEQPPRPADAPPYDGQAPERTNDGWQTASAAAADVGVDPLRDMIAAVAAGDLPSTHAILIARSGKLVFEQYFYGYDRDTLHDMRSASKSITSALVGLAVDRGLLDGADSLVLPLFPQYRGYDHWSAAKARIRIRNLLTMSSGLDANDADAESAAAEDNYQSQTERPDWIKLALDAPMVAEPGAHVVYGSANPMLLGGILANVAGDRVEWFADAALFAPLGIHSYRIYLDPTGVPYMGGGMHLRPRDMLKFGQLYLDGGLWQGRRVLSEGWIRQSFGAYGRLEPLERNGNEYGYLWWHEVYTSDGKSIASIEARGNGGQYIFVLPELDTVVVITSGNYRGGLEMTRQPQRIFRRYILPALLH